MPDENLPDDENVTQHGEQQSYSTSQITIPFGPHGRFTRGDELCSMKHKYKMCKKRNLFVLLTCSLTFFQSRCQTPAFQAKPHVQYHFVGITFCSEGHKYRFCSYQVNDVYANNLQVAACILLSGNQFSKIERLANFLNLEFISSSTYYGFKGFI